MISELEQELDQCRADLTHIDGALRVLRADLDPETIPPRRRYARAQYFGRNELSRLCMDTLRLAADEPLTAEEITIRIMTREGLGRAGRTPSRHHPRSGRGSIEAAASAKDRGAIRQGSGGDVAKLSAEHKPLRLSRLWVCDLWRARGATLATGEF